MKTGAIKNKKDILPSREKLFSLFIAQVSYGTVIFFFCVLCK